MISFSLSLLSERDFHKSNGQNYTCDPSLLPRPERYLAIHFVKTMMDNVKIQQSDNSLQSSNDAEMHQI